MRTFREILKVPSAALEAMCDGLLEQYYRKDFIIDMGTFGGALNGICYGCAATCAIQKASGVNFTEETIYSKHTAGGHFDIYRFEQAIDHARNGQLKYLFEYFHINPDRCLKYCNRWDMQNYNWKNEIPIVRIAIREMQEEGL